MAQVAKIYATEKALYLKDTMGCEVFKDSTPAYIAAPEDAQAFLQPADYYLADPIYPVYDQNGVQTIGLPKPKKPKK